MKLIETPLKGLVVIEPRVFEDSRGYFFESFNSKSFSENGIEVNFLQDNQSLSHKGVLRGLHFQAPPFDQGKLVRTITGSVLDVALDIRKNSTTYGQHFSIELSAQNKKILWIPPGFAHGFKTLEDNTIFFYKCTNYYHKDSEGCVLWNDKTLNIEWSISNPILSEKDKLGTKFSEFKSPF